MSIAPYVHRNIVSLVQSALARQAAELMSERKVGCVLVSDTRGELVGILTDRDLTCALADTGDHLGISISEMMTPRPVTVDESADLGEVIHLMEECGVRRIPVIRQTHEGIRNCTGIVTLDDLIAARVIDSDHLARIVRSQISRRWIAPDLGTRKTAKVAAWAKGHREQTLNDFYRVVSERVEIPPALLVQVTEYLLGCLIRRVHYTAAARFVSQLPKGLREDLLEFPAGPDSKLTPEAIREDLSSRFGFSLDESQSIITQFFPVLEDLLDPIEIREIKAQLPEDFQSVFRRPLDEEKRAA